MGNAAGQGNAAYDGGAAASAGNAAPGSAAAQPPVIPGLHPETQELLTARYGAPSGRYRHSEGPYGPPAPRYGRPATVRYPAVAFVMGWLVAFGMMLAVSLGFVFF